MNIDELTIGELKKIAALAAGLTGLPCSTAKPEHADGHKQIVVLQRGWVMVGTVVMESDNETVIYDAKNIRRWGTTKGLGQLAADGPNKDTVLDEYGTIRVHPLCIVFRQDCDSAKW